MSLKIGEIQEYSKNNARLRSYGKKILASVSLLLNWCAFNWEWCKYTHLNVDACVNELCFTGNKDFVLLSTIFVIL